jgi:hypothetical protein
MSKRAKAVSKHVKVVEAVSKLTSRPTIEGNCHTLILSNDEVIALMQILSFSKNVFAEMALNAQKENHMKDAEIMSARSTLSDIILSKIKVAAAIGEPESRELH